MRHDGGGRTAGRGGAIYRHPSIALPLPFPFALSFSLTGCACQLECSNESLVFVPTLPFVLHFQSLSSPQLSILLSPERDRDILSRVTQNTVCLPSWIHPIGMCWHLSLTGYIGLILGYICRLDACGGASVRYESPIIIFTALFQLIITCYPSLWIILDSSNNLQPTSNLRCTFEKATTAAHCQESNSASHTLPLLE